MSREGRRGGLQPGPAGPWVPGSMVLASVNVMDSSASDGETEPGAGGSGSGLGPGLGHNSPRPMGRRADRVGIWVWSGSTVPLTTAPPAPE